MAEKAGQQGAAPGDRLPGYRTRLRAAKHSVYRDEWAFYAFGFLSHQHSSVWQAGLARGLKEIRAYDLINRAAGPTFATSCISFE